MQELMDHLRVHYRPTQSLEGKAGTPCVASGWPFFHREVAKRGVKLSWWLFLWDVLPSAGRERGERGRCWSSTGGVLLPGWC